VLFILSAFKAKENKQYYMYINVILAFMLTLYCFISLYDLSPKYTTILLPVITLSFALYLSKFLNKTGNYRIIGVTILCLVIVSNTFFYKEAVAQGQNYKGAINYVGLKYPKAKVVSTSLGKREMMIYNNNIVQLFTKTQYDSLLCANDKMVAIVAFEEMAGTYDYKEDLDVLNNIKKDFKLDSVFAGEIEVKVYVRD
jgi:hypothetical protein